MKYVIERCVLLLGFLPALAASSPPIQDLQLESSQSHVRIYVHRAGLFKTFGHDHLVSSRQLTGWLRFTPGALSQATFNLTLPASSLVVDDPDIRRAVGGEWNAAVKPGVRTATRSNMLGKRLLDAGQYPDIHLRGQWQEGNFPSGKVRATVSMRGQDYALTIPVSVSSDGSRLRVFTRFTVTHIQLGLTPFTALGGALRVADRLEIEATLVFSRRH